MIKKYILIAGLFLMAVVGLKAQENNNFKVAKSIEIFSGVMNQLNLNYVDTIHPVQLTRTAIKDMLRGMDPYTIYVPEKDMSDFNLMLSGIYGGIGSMIQKQGDYVVITEPYEGFPAQKAGLKAGDKVIAINGKSAKNLSSLAVSKLLKGDPGSHFQLTIRHFGAAKDTTLNLTREQIKIPNVPYYGIVGGDIGYIRLTQFSPNAANDVRSAFVNLKENHHIKGVILDLRNNGGGLLNEAVKIANIFIKKGQTIVTTKGKLLSNNMVYKTPGPVIDRKILLAILVNGNTASASEIVSGSMQDLDRGVIIGQQTFGKGLVQNTVALPYGGKIKITIAKYYIPSGRCIQAINYFHRGKNGRPVRVPDSLTHTFKTADGRVVRDGGGIKPDIVMKPTVFSQVSADLYAQNYIFDFANEFSLRHKSIAPPTQFRIGDSTFNQFKKFVLNKGFSYKTETGALIKQLKQSAKRENYFKALKPVIDSLSKDLKAEKKQDLDKHKKQIDEMLRVEIATRYYYQKGKTASALINDDEVSKAVAVLNNKSLYESILSGKADRQKKK
ncbi:Carboxy-terminal processing protease [hydrothermal vent metagenome]|uniref:Carboxy-terminal processing protease n=1 Tax=hydrothermal vent metagenome TaxID=652676 RepID=A0A3B0UDH7_9ZZZZ